jgi:alkyl hydroperoxide reductase subunit AhpC
MVFCRIPLLALLFFLSCVSCGTCVLSPESLRRAPEIKGSVWFNIEQYPRISLKSLRGNVILLVFWGGHDMDLPEVFSQINALRDRYKDRGLEVIGIRDSEMGVNVSEAGVINEIRAFGIKFPVVMDSDGLIQIAYEQLGGVSLYLIDRKGYIRNQFSVDFSWKDVELQLRMLLEAGHSREWEQIERKDI